MPIHGRLIRVALLVLSCATFARAGDDAARYDERWRPQFHFTAPKGWLNDPNGLVYDSGTYHLFYQSNPAGTNWAPDLHWGHATSKDLVHWANLPTTIPPTPIPGGGLAGSWSGTGALDVNNTSGLGRGGEGPVVILWTAAGLGQCLAYSNDHGQTFTPYDHNPVMPMDPPKTGDWDRDPDVFWYEPGKHWVMVYSISGQGFVISNSPDLKHWTRRGKVEGMFECPSLFEMPVDGDPAARKWVLWDASGKYLVGRFDGQSFTAEAGPFLIDYGHNYYAALVWNNAPAGRHVSLTWMRDGRYPDMPFNQQMSVPTDLKLRAGPDGLRLTKYPIRELDQLQFDTRKAAVQTLDRWEANLGGDTCDLDVDIEPRNAGEINLRIRGAAIQYVPGLLRCLDQSAPLSAENGRIRLRILVDRTSIEVYANEGRASISKTFLPSDDDRRLEINADRGSPRIVSLRLSRMKSIWNKPRGD